MGKCTVDSCVFNGKHGLEIQVDGGMGCVGQIRQANLRERGNLGLVLKRKRVRSVAIAEGSGYERHTWFAFLAFSSPN